MLWLFSSSWLTKRILHIRHFIMFPFLAGCFCGLGGESSVIRDGVVFTGDDGTETGCFVGDGRTFIGDVSLAGEMASLESLWLVSI
jgi:hypothetical protein